MVSNLIGIPITDWGLGTIVVVFIVLIMTGRLVPYTTHKQLLLDRQEENERLRSENERLLEANDLHAQSAITTAKLLSSLPVSVDKDKPKDGEST